MIGVRVWRGTFWVYALALFTLTHWPKMRIVGPVPRTDLVLHLTMFGLWAFLLNRTRYLGRPSGGLAAGLCLAVSVAYGAIDEALQALPIVHRTAVLDDFIANMAGGALGTLLAWATARRSPSPSPGAAPVASSI